MDLKLEPPIELDEEPELAVSQVIARLRRVGSAHAETDRLLGDPTDDELLDQFWRRRSHRGRS